MEASRQTKLAQFPEEKQPVLVQFLKENKPRWSGGWDSSVSQSNLHQNKTKGLLRVLVPVGNSSSKFPIVQWGLGSWEGLKKEMPPDQGQPTMGTDSWLTHQKLSSNSTSCAHFMGGQTNWNFGVWSREKFLDGEGINQEHGRLKFVSDPSCWLAGADLLFKLLSVLLAQLLFFLFVFYFILFYFNFILFLNFTKLY